MRSRSAVLVSALALLSACSGSDCGAETELQAGEPCLGLFTYCTGSLLCCLAGASHTPVCAHRDDCRMGQLGEPCYYNPALGLAGRYAGCERPWSCVNDHCVCQPFCATGAALVWDDQSACSYHCSCNTRCAVGETCWQDERTCTYRCCESLLECKYPARSPSSGRYGGYCTLPADFRLSPPPDLRRREAGRPADLRREAGRLDGRVDAAPDLEPADRPRAH